MDTKQIFNIDKTTLIKHSLNEAYSLNSTSVIIKAEPTVVQYVLTTNSILDLSLNTFRFKKNATKVAFKTSYCRELVGNCSIQTVQIVPHYSSKISSSKTRMIASITPPLVSNISKRGCAVFKTATTALPTPINLENSKHLKQHKKNTATRRPYGEEKHITKSKQMHYLAPLARLAHKLGKRNNKRFFTPIDPFFIISKKPQYSKRQQLIPNYSKGRAEGFFNELVLSAFKLVRPQLSFHSRIGQPLMGHLYDRFHGMCPLLNGGHLSSTFTPNFSLQNQKPTAHQKWEKAHHFRENKNLISSLFRADWVLNQLINQCKLGKKNPRAIMNQLINDIRILLEKMGSESPILGVRVTLTGRLGSRKKGMAQQISKCVGKIPLSTLRQKVDYSQGFLTSRLGLIGVKVWMCYK